ncbi:hypothetical protein VIBNISFn118_1190023 [Vibrio nigripulchritudo SFn118]|nr:hypothetical protein VIBNISFn118_1190023 [Vibrio nigripulchritudo SFn118]
MFDWLFITMLLVAILFLSNLSPHKLRYSENLQITLVMSFHFASVLA